MHKLKSLLLSCCLCLFIVPFAQAETEVVKTRYGDITIDNKMGSANLYFDGKALLEYGYDMDSWLVPTDKVYALKTVDLLPIKLAPISNGYTEYDHFVVAIKKDGKASLLHDEKMYSTDPSDYMVADDTFNATYGTNKLSYDGKQMLWNKASLLSKYDSKDCDYLWQQKDILIESAETEYPAQWYVSSINLFKAKYKNFTASNMIQALSLSKTQQDFKNQYCQ